jgi:trans-aconitate methyltransferase
MADQWDSSLYEDRHSFVWKASADLIDLLRPTPGERILDLGCGTGHLTAKIAESGAEVIGVDSSPSMIGQARQNYPRLKFVLADAREFHFSERFDGIFSNAALHWIPEAEAVVQRISAALHPGGRFVAEMGAKQNTVRLTTALDATLRERGYRPRNPWYFPSAGEYSSLLERYGFEMRHVSVFDRWIKLEHPERGLREWLEMFAWSWFENVGDADEIVRDVETRLRRSLWCSGAWWVDYKRLRIVARKTEDTIPNPPSSAPPRVGEFLD